MDAPALAPAPAARRKRRRICRSPSASARMPETASAASWDRDRGRSFQNFWPRCRGYLPCGLGSLPAVGLHPPESHPQAPAPDATAQARPRGPPTGRVSESVPDPSGPCSPARPPRARAVLAFAFGSDPAPNKFYPRHAAARCTCYRKWRRHRQRSWPSPSPFDAAPPQPTRCRARSSGIRLFRSTVAWAWVRF